ncbi:MAG TPA: hypothetical protein VJL89_10445 [Thermodesulfovibrionia bacterium]|nr:hypothetical protein [Thermodesulfovibrionia bacterium]
MKNISKTIKTALIAAGITFAIFPLHSLYTVSGFISKAIKWYKSMKKS